MSQLPLIEMHAKKRSPHATGDCDEYACCMFAKMIRANHSGLGLEKAVLHEVWGVVAYYRYEYRGNPAACYEFHFPIDTTCCDGKCLALRHALSLEGLMSTMDEEAEKKKEEEEEEEEANVSQ